MNEFGNFIKALREGRKWGLREAARQIKVPHSRLFELETGTSSKTGMPVKPTRDNILKLSAGYGVPKDQLFGLAHFPDEFAATTGLSGDEMAVLELYRGLSPAKRKLWLSVGEDLRALAVDEQP